ncbi:MAG TPA: class I SAM-dependent methyltransferase [Acidimicrobiia bacterium]
MPNSWTDPGKAAYYLERADRLPFRSDGEDVLVRDLGAVLPGRVLDLGCGDGRLAALLLAAYPDSAATVVDGSPPMLDAAHERFDGDERVVIVAHDLDDRLPRGHACEGPFDAVVSSLAIHHVEDARKRELYREIAELLAPGGIAANLDVVASPTQALHDVWRDEMAVRDDPDDRLCDLDTQLGWLREAGLDDVDCIWKWRSLALLRGARPRV